jgi:hypothetical protein
MELLIFEGVMLLCFSLFLCFCPELYASETKSLFGIPNNLYFFSFTVLSLFKQNYIDEGMMFNL